MTDHAPHLTRLPWPAADTSMSVVDVVNSSSGRARSPRRSVVVDLADEGRVVDVADIPASSGDRTPPAYEPVLEPRDRAAITVLAAVWAVLVIGFWAWWLQSSHVVTPLGMTINTIVLLYVSVLPIMYVCAVLRLRRVNPLIPIPRLAAALVVTKAPSEPWPVVEKTLRAMLDQDYPHPYDVWLCDEAPSEATVRWCAENGVMISTRQGIGDYHRLEWPRRTKCKEGNLAYFYDHWGYAHYDVVAQLDADHVPAPTYLAEMVRPFADPDVGYVAAPSVCDSNAADSWAARGRLYREATFHGPVQTGANDGWAPVCIGSHYAVRTRALRDIGGLGPELAEDFTTSYLLNVAGWSGSFACDADASGEGPATFGAMAVQEFQWARSLFTVLLDLVPKTIGRLPWRLRLRFGYSLLYYPSLVAATAAGVLLPPVAGLRGEPWVSVNYLLFLPAWLLPPLALVTVTLLLRSRGALRPRKAKVLGWELWLYVFCRWVFVGWGLVAALIQKIRPQQVTFKVTPKQRGLEPLPARFLLPFVAITVVACAGHVVGLGNPPTVGYALLSLLGAVIYTLVAAACVALHVQESRRATGEPWATALTTVRTATLAVAVQVAVLAGAVTWALVPWLAGMF